MNLRYKKVANGDILYGIGPIAGKGLRIFYRFVNGDFIVYPKVLAEMTFIHIFGKSNKAKITEDESDSLGNLCEDLKACACDINYQDEEENIARSSIYNISVEILPPLSRRIRGKLKNHIKRGE